MKRKKKFAFLVIAALLWTDIGYADIIMKNIGGNLSYTRYPYNLCDVKSTHRYFFPSLDCRNNPQYVMTLMHESTYKRRTICLYKLEDLCQLEQNSIRPVFTYPAHGKSKGPGAYNALETPVAFFSGLFFLAKTKTHSSIYKINTSSENISTVSFYHDNEFPVYVDKTYDGVAYAKNNIIYRENHNSLYSDRIISDDILSFHLPRNKYFAVSYYTKDHNPDILLTVNNRQIPFNNTKINELNPKFSQDLAHVAFFRNQPNDQYSWELVVYRTASMNRESMDSGLIKSIPDIEIYDSEELAFSFYDSFQWVQNKLYYKKSKNPSRQPLIYQYNPVSRLENKLILSKGVHTWNIKHTSRNGKPKLLPSKYQINIKQLGWFQVAHQNNGLIVIAECNIETQHRLGDQTNDRNKLVKRILVFREKNH